MNTIVINTQTEKEYKIYRDILAMIETAKIHGFAEIKIKIQNHDILQGSMTLDTRWN